DDSPASLLPRQKESEVDRGPANGEAGEVLRGRERDHRLQRIDVHRADAAQHRAQSVEGLADLRGCTREMRVERGEIAGMFTRPLRESTAAGWALPACCFFRHVLMISFAGCLPFP